jgi:hypothetical protein
MSLAEVMGIMAPAPPAQDQALCILTTRGFSSMLGSLGQYTCRHQGFLDFGLSQTIGVIVPFYHQVILFEVSQSY